MSNENQNVVVGVKVGIVKDDKGNKVALNMPVRIERVFYDFLDRNTGKRITGKKLQLSFEYAGESFRLVIDKDDAKLLNYIMKNEGFALLDGDGFAIDESTVR